MQSVTSLLVARRWRLRGIERRTLADLARTLGISCEDAKWELACAGLRLAWLDSEDWWQPLERAAYNRRLLTRAIYHARKALADAGPPPARFVELNADIPVPPTDDTLLELAEQPHAPGVAVADLLALATAPQERLLVRAFLEDGCATLADVDRLYGWSHGHAAVLASRLRRKAAQPPVRAA